MDLDNIDSVFRMGHYLGFSGATKDHALPLVDGFRILSGAAHPSLIASAYPDALHWKDLRTRVYRLFIYDPEYLSFEAQVFELIDALSELLTDPRELAAAADFPDDVLLWQYFLDDSFAELRPLIRRLIALVPYRSLVIARIRDVELCNALPTHTKEAIARLRHVFVETVRERIGQGQGSEDSEGPLALWLKTDSGRLPDWKGSIHLHLTTDKRKTERELVFSIVEQDTETRIARVGADGYYVIATLMVEGNIPKKEEQLLQDAFRHALTQLSGATVEILTGEGVQTTDQLSLEL